MDRSVPIFPFYLLLTKSTKDITNSLTVVSRFPVLIKRDVMENLPAKPMCLIFYACYVDGSPWEWFNREKTLAQESLKFYEIAVPFAISRGFRGVLNPRGSVFPPRKATRVGMCVIFPRTLLLKGRQFDQKNCFAFNFWGLKSNLFIFSSWHNLY